MDCQKISRIRECRGFTIVELLIVASIIGILAAIAMPQYTRFSGMSRRAEGVSLLRAVHLSEISYLQQYNKYILNATQLIMTTQIIEVHPRPKFYYGLQLFSDPGYDTRGYLSAFWGNIDADPTEDILTFRYENPGPSLIVLPEGTSVYNDDLLL